MLTRVVHFEMNNRFLWGTGQNINGRRTFPYEFDRNRTIRPLDLPGRVINCSRKHDERGIFW